MSTADHLYNIALAGVSFVVLVSMLWTIPKLESWWKPIYLCALPIAVLPVVMIALVEFPQIVGTRAVLPLLKFFMFFVALQVTAFSTMHRWERKEREKAAERAAEAQRKRISAGENDE